MSRVSNTLIRLSRRLFNEPEQRQQFVDALSQPADYPVAVVWMPDARDIRASSPLATLPRPEWMPEFVDIVPFSERPGRHPLHSEGKFYCLDASSVFMATGLTLADHADVVLDMCSSPGGKAVMSHCLLNPEQLFCNEVIGKRLGALISNLKRCRVSSARVISADPRAIADAAAGTADVVIVDAPCSGQSLVARGKNSPGCFHPATINMNSNRQRRILANAAAAVRKAGLLLYMTCTYSLKENERVVEWFLKRHPEFSAVSIPQLTAFQSLYSEFPCYRMWPMSGIGAGGFTAAMVRTDQTDGNNTLGRIESIQARWQFSADGSFG